MEKRIIDLFNNDGKYSLKEIKNALHLQHLNNSDIKETLVKLCEEEKIVYLEESNSFQKVGDSLKIVDLLSTSKGYIYFINENNDRIIISSPNLNGATAFSRVLLQKKDNNYNVVKVLERKYNKVVCEVKEELDHKYLVPISTALNCQIRICDKDLKTLADGDRILVEIGNTLENNCMKASLVKVICHRNAPDKELLSIAYSKDFDPEFSLEAIKELEAIDDFVHPEEIEGRLDLRGEVIFTIDGINTKDMDDAISLKVLENGNYQLGVHIADVAHYVKPGSHLFQEAQERGTSLYMIESVIPMLPAKLSNGICSLNPNVDRLTKSIIMEFDKNGNLVDSELTNSVIRSKKKMDYDSINHILENGIIPEGYEEYYEHLKLMQKLSNIFTNQKRKDGKLDFVSNEIEVKVNDEGRPLDFGLVRHGEGERLIENFMIAANETIASYFPQLPFVYRVHGIPDELKIDDTINFLTSMGYRLNTCGNAGSPKLIQNILNSLSNEPEYSLLSNIILRSMKKAEYSIDNIGHFGLASDYYTHFTSPIRRFPDLQVHTLIDLYLTDLTKLDWKALEEHLNTICIHSSYKERQADAAEEESKRLMMAKYMSYHIGEDFTGIVISNESNNIKVRTDNLIYGKVLLPENQKLNRKGYKLGTNVLLRVEQVSLVDYQIYFSIVKRLDPKEKEELNKQKVLQKKQF